MWNLSCFSQFFVCVHSEQQHIVHTTPSNMTSIRTAVVLYCMSDFMGCKHCLIDW